MLPNDHGPNTLGQTRRLEAPAGQRNTERWRAHSPVIMSLVSWWTPLALLGFIMWGCFHAMQPLHRPAELGFRAIPVAFASLAVILPGLWNSLRGTTLSLDAAARLTLTASTIAAICCTSYFAALRATWAGMATTSAAQAAWEDVCVSGIKVREREQFRAYIVDRVWDHDRARLVGELQNSRLGCASYPVQTVDPDAKSITLHDGSLLRVVPVDQLAFSQRQEAARLHLARLASGDAGVMLRAEGFRWWLIVALAGWLAAALTGLMYRLISGPAGSDQSSRKLLTAFGMAFFLFLLPDAEYGFLLWFPLGVLCLLGVFALPPTQRRSRQIAELAAFCSLCCWTPLFMVMTVEDPSANAFEVPFLAAAYVFAIIAAAAFMRTATTLRA